MIMNANAPFTLESVELAERFGHGSCPFSGYTVSLWESRYTAVSLAHREAYARAVGICTVVKRAFCMAHAS